jgi:hypothetical protein
MQQAFGFDDPIEFLQALLGHRPLSNQAAGVVVSELLGKLYAGVLATFGTVFAVVFRHRTFSAVAGVARDRGTESPGLGKRGRVRPAARF